MGQSRGIENAEMETLPLWLDLENVWKWVWNQKIIYSKRCLLNSLNVGKSKTHTTFTLTTFKTDKINSFLF